MDSALFILSVLFLEQTEGKEDVVKDGARASQSITRAQLPDLPAAGSLARTKSIGNCDSRKTPVTIWHMHLKVPHKFLVLNFQS